MELAAAAEAAGIVKLGISIIQQIYSIFAEVCKDDCPGFSSQVSSKLNIFLIIKLFNNKTLQRSVRAIIYSKKINAEMEQLNIS